MRILYLLLFQAPTKDHTHIARIDGVKLQPSFSYQANQRSKTWTGSSCWSKSTSRSL